MLASLILTAALAAATSKPEPAPMSLEQKAGCGVALTVMGDSMTRLGPMDELKPGERGAVKMLLRVMSQDGRTMLGEAFSQGAARNMTPMQVYEAGLNDLLSNIGPVSVDSDGEEIMNRLAERCMS